MTVEDIVQAVCFLQVMATKVISHGFARLKHMERWASSKGGTDVENWNKAEDLICSDCTSDCVCVQRSRAPSLLLKLQHDGLLFTVTGCFWASLRDYFCVLKEIRLLQLIIFYFI